MKALDIFQHMIKCKQLLVFCDLSLQKWLTNSNQISYKQTLDEKNPKLKEIYNRKAEEYFERAAYLKKQVLQPEKDVSVGGGSAAQQKPK